MTEKNYAQSIAGDLFRMISAAQKQGVHIDQGFRNEAFSSPQLVLTYLFLKKKDLLKIPSLPPQVKKQVRKSNALVTLESKDTQGQRKTIGVHLLWSSAQACSEITSEQEMLGGIQIQGLAAYTAQFKSVLKNDAQQTLSQDAQG